MTYQDSISFLYGLQKFGMKFGLQGIRHLLQSIGNPERRFPAIHIAGTNGKGSTASMIAAMFTAAGYKTGLYTSPHLLQFNERIRINGVPIASRDVSRLTAVIRPTVVKNRNTFFEAVTAMGFQYFAEQNVEIAIIETGLGGRLDATNVLQPLVSVITSIGLEHTHILGGTIDKIAKEKAGIIKRNIPCITAAADPSARKVIAGVCERRSSPIQLVRENQFSIHHASLSGLTADFHLSSLTMTKLKLSLPGAYQAMNALLSLAVVETINQQHRFYISERSIRTALADIHRYTGLQARLSLIHTNPMILADVAHNPDAMKKLCSAVQALSHKKFRVVFGLMQDKNLEPMIPVLVSLADSIHIVQAKTARSSAASEIAEAFPPGSVPIKCFRSVNSGVKAFLRNPSQKPILITGSHFVVGEALAMLQGKKYLTINQ